MKARSEINYLRTGCGKAARPCQNGSKEFATRSVWRIIVLCLLPFSFLSCKGQYQKISNDDFNDKMQGAWIGQMAGVGWGLPTEFKWTTIIPVDKVPEWKNSMINQHGNDDLYVELTFMESMKQYGLDVSQIQAGIDFANSGYYLWAANRQGRDNLRKGIAPPESGHPQNNRNCDDIDYQIEADYSGIIAPGMPNVPIAMGEKFGGIMNYGDGMYGGQFVGGMYSAAYFLKDIPQIIEAGLACIPSESLYTQVIRDVIKWHGEHPDNFELTWNLIMDKYYHTLDNQPFQKKLGTNRVGIDSKVNGAFIVMGLLYGNGDMDSTIIYSMRCGLDSDCNPSNAAGILGTVIGFKGLDEKFKAEINYDRKFSYSDYNLKDLYNISTEFARELIVRNGGKIEADENGAEYLYIKEQSPTPSEFVASYAPGPYNADNRFTPEEILQIKAWPRISFREIYKKPAFDAVLIHAGREVKPELIEWNCKEQVLITTPMSNERSAFIEIQNKDFEEWGNEEITATLSFMAGHEKGESWKLLLNGKEHIIVGDSNSKYGWVKVEIPVKKGMKWVNLEAANSEGKSTTNYWTDFKMELR